MEDPELTCPKCEGEMEPGFLADESRGRVKSGRWIEGAPTLRLSPEQFADRRSFEVDAYRCLRCGYLEFYAGMGED